MFNDCSCHSYYKISLHHSSSAKVSDDFLTFKLPAVDLILPPQGSRSRGLKLDELCPPEDNEVEVTS